MIRDRAGLVTPDLGTFNKSTFQLAIWAERWHELSYECITWFDMLRLRKVYDVGTKTFIEFAGALVNGATLGTKHYLLPVACRRLQKQPKFAA